MRNMQDESNQRLIMIVDDDQALGEMLSIVLESEGFKTVTCLDGWRAVEMFPTLQPDLMLLDVMLPGLDGVQVAQRIRQNYHHAYRQIRHHRCGERPGSGGG